MFLPKVLASLTLFEGYSETEIHRLLNLTRYRIKTFDQKQTIFFEQELYRSLHILIKGQCTGEMNSYGGKTIKVEQFTTPQVIAPGILFSKKPHLPVSLVADTAISMLVIDQQDFLNLITCEQPLLKNLLEEISGKISLLSRKLEFMSFKTIREKMTHYLLSASRGRDKFKIAHSIEALALFFGVARQSLSRVLQEMESEGLFHRNRRHYTLLKRAWLETIQKNSNSTLLLEM